MKSALHTATILVALVGGMILTGCSRPTVDDNLKRFSDEFNAKLPMELDEYTRLETTATEPGARLIYTYTLIDIATTADVEGDVLMAAMRPELTENYKTNADMAWLRENSVILVYRYHAEDDALVFEVEIDPSTF